MSTKDLSAANYENTPGTHVYIPELESDYRSIYTGKILKVINNPNPDIETVIVNNINLPPFCTATANPGPRSWMKISYPAKKTLIEVFTFEKYINSFIGHMIVRDVEYLTQEFAREITTALGQGVEIEAFYDLVGFKYGQGVTVIVKTTDVQAAKWREEYPSKYQAHLDKVKAEKAEKAAAHSAAKEAKDEKKACPVATQLAKEANNKEAKTAEKPTEKEESTQANSRENANPSYIKETSSPVTISAYEDYLNETYDSQVGYDENTDKDKVGFKVGQADVDKFYTERAKPFLQESYDDQIGYGAGSRLQSDVDKDFNSKQDKKKESQAQEGKEKTCPSFASNEKK